MVKTILKDDPLFKDLIIYYSGPSDPGEGEHKILDLIR